MNRKCIKSYAFLDLETTGLPDIEFNKTKITEICLVSSSKDGILSAAKNQLPRVLNKLSFCVNPFKQISSQATRITGLDNFMLENENKFDENFVKLLNHYFLQLPQPVCLVAHNGDKFDFPIIQRQLRTLNASLPDDILCMDSLAFFRYYEDLMWQEKLDEPKPLPDGETIENESKETISANNVDQTIETTNDESCPPVTSTNEIECHETVQPCTSTVSIPHEMEDINEALAAEDTKQKQLVNESTPSDRKTLVKRAIHSKRLLTYGDKSVTPVSKRQLFTPPNGDSVDSPSKRMKFTLTAVHERFFGHAPNQSHYAENDVLALLKCAVASKFEFIEYAEGNARLFSDIKPIGM